jgi:uncharacterized membrane protein
VILRAVNNGLRPWFYGYYGEFGSTPIQAAWNALAHPSRTIRVLLRPDGLLYVWMMFAPTALLGAVRIDVLLIGLPMLAANLLSGIGYHREIRFQSSAVLVAAIALATVEAVALLGKKSPVLRRFLVGAIVATSLAATVAWGPSPISTKFQGLWPTGDPRRVSKREAIAIVPRDAPVSASYYLVPHLTHRAKVYDFPAPWTPANWGMQGENLHDPAEVRWIVVDRTTSGEESETLLDRLLAEEFDAQFERDGIVVAKRIRSPEGASVESPP